MELKQCPVCRSEQFDVLNESDAGNRATVRCPRCGTFVIGKMAAFLLLAEPVADHRLSAWIRQKELNKATPPILLKENLEQLRLALPAYSVSERTRELLKSLAILSNHPGERVSGSLFADAPLAWAENSDEAKFHFQALERAGYIQFSDVDFDANYFAVVTSEGWEQVERGPASILPIGFVAMSFSADMVPSWVEGLRPGIEDAGYSAHRVDSEPHIRQIDQKIVADIRTSRFVVVDVTQQKQGAYFEAGLALGFGKTVIWTVREDDLKNVHFDTRQFAHIVWKSHADLRSKLKDVIVAILGLGPKPIPSR